MAPLPAGEVAVPSQRAHAHCYTHTDGPDERERIQALGQLRASVWVVAGEAQSDAAGHGVLAMRRLAAGETLVDPSVFYVARPPDYALAHLPQYHALEFGREAYFLLREPALRQSSLTYYVNEAHHAGCEGPPPNVAYKVVRPRNGGIALALYTLAPIEQGVELLASYNQKLAFRA